MTTAYTVLPHHSETEELVKQTKESPVYLFGDKKDSIIIPENMAATIRYDKEFGTSVTIADFNPYYTNYWDSPGTITIIQALGATGAGTTLGTMADTAGTTATIPGTITAGTGVGTEASTTHGTTAHGILASTTHTITTCTHTTADGTEDGDLTTAASITDRHTEEDISLSAAERCSEAHEARL